MKNFLTAILLLSSGVAGMAQGVFRNQTNTALEKVVQDYPLHFKNIKGELLSSAQGSAEFRSTVAIPGAVSTTITQSAAAQKQLVCWQSVVFDGKEFNTAKTRFEELYNQIKNTIIKPVGEKAVIVNGMYTNPAEDKSYTIIQFDLLPASGTMQKLNIDLMMKKAGTAWTIILSVYDRERQDSDLTLVK